MRHAIGPRREMGQRTIFNVLGPLTNPARATHQLLGVYDPALTETLAQVLASLGSQAACVVHGPDGLDELSTAGLNRISRLAGGRVTTSSLDPRELDLAPATLADLAGGLPADNARLTRDILSGADRGPRRDVVLLNAAAALTLDGDAWPPAVARAREAIDSGAALACLEAWIATTHRLGAKS
jgi:anthranilate phosphoribosyltransferase